jgi:acyl-CoA dehydrogenase family protein 9
VLRKHGRDIAEMQFAQRRIADIAIDLYGLAACISRTTRAIERRGEEGARREIDLTTVFAGMAHKRLRSERRAPSRRTTTSCERTVKPRGASW